MATGRGGGGERDGEAAVGVDEGEHVAAEAGLEAHHGIAGEHFEGLSLVALGWAGFARPGRGLGAPPGIQADGGVSHLVGGPSDEAPDGGDTGHGEALLRTPRTHQDVQFSLPEIGIAGPEAAEFLPQRRGPLRLAATAGSAGAGGQGGGMAPGFA